MLPSVYVSVMNGFRFKNIDFPLGSFDLAKEILSARMDPSLGGFVGTSYRNETFHGRDYNRSMWSVGRFTLTIWGKKRVDKIELNRKVIWRRHWWTMKGIV